MSNSSDPSSGAPLFSVVIPSYNRGSTLGALIQRLLAQEGPKFEIVLVDDGSTDGTPTVAKSIEDPRFKYLRQDNAGPCSARNTGAAVASGLYLIFLDDDDEPEESWLSGLASLSDGKGRPGVLGCGVRVVDATSGREFLVQPEPVGPAFDNHSALFFPGAYAVDRTLFLDSGGFDLNARYGEHTELALRLLPACTALGLSVAVRGEPLVVKNHDRSREISLKYADARLSSVQYFLTKHQERLERQPELLASFLAVGGVSAVQLGDLATARALFLRAWRTFPGSPFRWPRLKHLARAMLASIPFAARRIW
jgi:glycosyltransferase involved in cell wall biosynthesis